MRNNKFIFMALILLVSLLCVSAVSAADDAASDIVADTDTNDATVLEESIDDASISGSQSEENVLKDNSTSNTFADLDNLIKNGGKAIELKSDYSYADSDSLKNGIAIDHDLTLNGNGHTINGSNQARIFRVANNATVTFKNIIFVNGFVEEGYSGAIWANGATNAVNCTFIENHAHYGGAISVCDAIDCNFINNSAADGGAMYRGTATNSRFTQNVAAYGGAIAYGNGIGCIFENNHASTNGGAIYQGNATNCIFTNNSASDKGGAIFRGDVKGSAFTGNSANYGGAIRQGNAINSNFTGNSATEGSGGAIDIGHAQNCIFTSNVAGKGGAIYNGDAVDSTFTANQADGGGAMCGDSENYVFCTALNCTFNNNSATNGGAIFLGNATNSSFTGNSLLFGLLHAGTAMSSAEGYSCLALNCIFTNNNADGDKAINNAIADSCVFNGDEVDNETVVVYKPALNFFNFITTYDDSLLVLNITSNSGMLIGNANFKVDVYTSTGTFVGTYNIKSGGWKLPFGAGAYVATYNATDYDLDNVEGMIIVDKSKTTVSSKAVTAVYNNNKYLVITLKDSKGKAISGAKVTVTLASAKAYKTDKNGQIKINIGKLIPKTYTAKISFAGNTNYLSSSTTAKVVVKKATPKMTAKAKTFKVKVKTKKFKITLKNNLKKVMKNTKVTLRVNKKTFTAKTNKKGVATFKITNLKKKGKFTATIKYAGSKYYNKVTKKVKITVKK